MRACGWFSVFCHAHKQGYHRVGIKNKDDQENTFIGTVHFLRGGPKLLARKIGIKF